MNSSSAYHGFIRDGGRTTVFDVPGSLGTFPTSISLTDEIIGQYAGPNGGLHGFLRYANGEFVTFDPPDGEGLGGTYPDSINARGEIAGVYSTTETGKARGFLRLSDGSFITFDAPGVAVNTREGTTPTSINSRGEIVGKFVSSGGFGFDDGFLRYRDGTMATFAIGPGPTAASSINQSDEVVGGYGDGTTNNGHGFIRFADGSIVTLDVPGATRTAPQSINSCGEIAGTYYDSNGGTHGFIAIPDHREDHRQEWDEHECSDCDRRR